MQLRLDTGVLDLDARLLVASDGAVALSPMEARLLGYLAARLGQAVDQDVLLRDVWGYAATTRTRTVRSTVNRLRNKLERDPATPRHLTTDRGFGYCLVAEPIGDEPRSTVPPPDDGTIGRDRELAALAAADGWLVALTGPFGAGRTHLARRFASGCDAVWVDAADATDAESVWAAIVSAVGRQARAPHDAAIRAVEERPRARWVLDDLEAGIDALAGLHAAVPTARFLVTRRSPTGLDGEQILQVGPLDPADAVSLLVRRVRARDLAAPIAPTDPALADIAAALDHLPRALELAAPRVALLGAPTLADWLGRHGLAAVPGAAFPEADLEDDDRAALDALTACSGAVAVDLAEALAGGTDALARLVDRALLVRAGRGTVRVLRAVVDRRPPTDIARDRHLDVVLARSGTPLEADRHELRAALAFALTTRHPAIVPLVRALDVLHAASGPVDAHLAVLTSARAHLDPGEHAFRWGRALRLAGRYAEALAAATAVTDPDDVLKLEIARCQTFTGHESDAIRTLDAVSRSTADVRLRGEVRSDLARALRAAGRLGDADHAARQALADLPTDAIEERAWANITFAQVMVDQGRIDEAVDVLLATVDDADDAELPAMSAHARLGLGGVRMMQGFDREAAALFRHAAEYGLAAGRLQLELLARLRSLAHAVERGEPSAELAETCRRLERRTPNRSVRGWIDANVALAALDHGDSDAAAVGFDLALASRTEGTVEWAAVRVRAAWVPLVTGDRAAARDWLAPAMAPLERCNVFQTLAAALLTAALAAPDPRSAIPLLERGRTIGGHLPELRALAAAIEALLLGRAVPVEARTWVGRSAAVRLTLGLFPSSAADG